MQPLPVDELLPEIVSRLRESNGLILEAPPGSGKTTRVAAHLLEQQMGSSDRKIFLLQPRRVAARSTAQRIAEERGWQLGGKVGYQVRFDGRVSDETALIVATEGILLRKLANDPMLEDVGTVILDEFHERSVNADLLLAVVRNLQQLVRDDLRIIIMSATLDTEEIRSYLKAPVVRTEGTLHPVDIRYKPSRLRQSIAEHTAEAVHDVVARREGDVLVFLPGVGEIGQTERLLQQRSLKGCEILPLHGSLPLDQQTRVLRAGELRRVILATNIAETSLTIEGIRTVIDSGQARVLRFDADAGLNRLQLEPISKSSATQRAGRAGRLEAGVCIRLWDEKSHRARPEHLEPEIRRTDLSSTLLQLYLWGESPDDFPWFTRPREESLFAAEQLLELLGAVLGNKITKLGHRMAKLPLEPRLARLLIEAEAFDSVPEMALVAAILGERDPFLSPRSDGNRGRPPTRSQRQWRCDITQRLLALMVYYESGNSTSMFGDIHRVGAKTIRRIADQFIRLLQPGDGASHDSQDAEELEVVVAQCLLAAFPDRLARRRKPGDPKGKMVGGRGVRLANTSGVAQPELFLCIDVDNRATEANVRKATGIEPEWLHGGIVSEREELFFNPTRKQVEARRRTYWYDLLLSEKTSQISDRDQCAELLFKEASRRLDAVAPNEESAFASFGTRLQCLGDWCPHLNLPAFDDALRLSILKELCHDKRSFSELQSAPWIDWLKSKLTPDQIKAVDRECPERIEVPSGSRIKIDYAVGKPPVLAVRIQEIFSWTTTPRIGCGRIPLLLHLLAPNYRPQQVTDDLASFWATTYEVVRKELRRRYPKHKWPEDPLTATPECKGGRRR